MPQVYKANLSHVLEVAHIAGLCKSLVRSVRNFPLHKLRIIKRRFVQELDDHSVAKLKNFKETQASVLVLVVESKKEEVCGLEACTW